jgi:hypothetical protein
MYSFIKLKSNVAIKCTRSCFYTSHWNEWRKPAKVCLQNRLAFRHKENGMPQPCHSGWMRPESTSGKLAVKRRKQTDKYRAVSDLGLPQNTEVKLSSSTRSNGWFRFTVVTFFYDPNIIFIQMHSWPFLHHYLFTWRLVTRRLTLARS